MTDALIIDAVRTPRGIGKPGKGALAHLHPQHLAATVLNALKERNNLETGDIDDIVWSTSTQKGKQGGDLARMAALDAGFDIKASGMTLDRFCGGGITSVNLAAAQIMSGMEDLVIAGGTEMMSYTTTVGMQEAGAGFAPMGMGSGNTHLQALHPQSHQGVCGDAIAAIEGISREDVDALALESQRRADVAIQEGRFSKSLIPVLNEADISIQPDGETFRQSITRKYQGLEFSGVHHAGNSSGVVDGAAAILLASPSYAKAHGLKARARVVATANMGDCPTLMLNAPVAAANKVLAKAGLTPDDIDLWEINEAFAVVAEKFIRDLKLDRNKVNVNGGAIALGHPIGATGTMLIGTVLDELERRGLKRGLITMCAAGGMAPAIIIEIV
jgi:acetyl-CoA C-acetyltransferase